MSWGTSQIIQRQNAEVTKWAGTLMTYNGRTVSLLEWANLLRVRPITMINRWAAYHRGAVTRENLFAVNRTLPAIIKATIEKNLEMR